MSKESSTRSGGIGFLGLLGIVFIVLKLCKVIDWDWFWVLTPLWGPFGVILGVLLIYGSLKLVLYVIESKETCQRRIAREQRARLFGRFR